jgi:hypothetical protein
MRAIRWVLLAASVFAFTALGLSAVQAAEQRSTQAQDHWRYLFHNGEWWYWMPQGRWVYWRDNRWNDYNPRTFTYDTQSFAAGDYRVGSVPSGGVGPIAGNRAAPTPDNRPFYGHAISNLDRRPLEANGEVGPFYGHALPSEVFGGWRSIRPYYGHAVSSDGN